MLSFTCSYYMNLKRFDTVPTQTRLKWFLIVLFFLFIVMMIFVNYMFSLSNYPVSFMESQLCFSGKIIKSHFAQMTPTDLHIYTLAQFVDYGYMIVYGLLILVIGIFLGRLIPLHSRWHYTSYLFGLTGIVATCCDGVENIFILLMISNPTGFPNSFAVIHSCFASIKFALLGFFIIWFIVLSMFIILKRRQQKKKMH